MLSFNSVCPLPPLYIKIHVHNGVWLLMLVSLNAEVLVVVVAVGCVQGSRSQVSAFSCGLCAGFLITGLCFQLTLTTSLWHIMPVRGYQKKFKNLCYNTDWLCFAETVSPATVFVRILGSCHPGTRLPLVPGLMNVGSVLILGQVTQYGNPLLTCIALGGVRIAPSVCSRLFFTVNKTLNYSVIVAKRRFLHTLAEVV